MTIAFSAFRGSKSTTGGSNPGAQSPTANIVANRIVIVIATWKRVDGIPAATISDTDGHTWTQLYALTQGGSNLYTAAWFTVTTATISTSDSITVNLSNLQTDGQYAVGILEFTFDTSMGIREAHAEATANGSSTSPSVTHSSMPATSKLLLGVISIAGPNADTFTQDADYLNNTSFGAGSGTNAASMRFGTRISTVTSDTYAPTLGTSRVWNDILFALEEYALGTPQALAASLSGAGAFAGALKRGVLLQSALAGAAAAAPALKRGVLMKTSLAGVATAAPALKRGVLLKTSLAGVGSLTAIIATLMKASLNGAGSASGALIRGAGLRAALAGIAAMSPAMTAGRGLRASLAGAGGVAAVMHLGFSFRASFSGVGSVNGVLTQVVVVIVPTRQRPRIYIHDGASLHRIAQLTAVTDLNRSYALREHVRTASFTIALSDDALQFTNPRDAHVIWIESSEYPLPWVGRIVDREGKRADRTVTITADSYDAILGERVLSSDFTTPGATRTAFQSILARLNGMNATGIGVGYVEDGKAAPMSLPNARGVEALDKLAEVAGMEWWLSYALEGPTLVIQANLARERGADLYSSVVLTGPDGNFEVEGWRENGRGSAYAQTVVGGESSVLEAFTERERSVALADGQSNRSDPETLQLVVEAQRVLRFDHLLAGETSFIAPTQRRELLAVREELKEAGITGEVAEALFMRRRLPSQVILGRAYPDARETWKYLEPGNVVHLVAGDAFIDGYDGPAVVVATQPMEHQRFVDVVVEVS